MVGYGQVSANPNHLGALVKLFCDPLASLSSESMKHSWVKYKCNTAQTSS